ncbi:Sister chromatid cohesion protein DCC1 [Desmophyllum pertusum]|uniref:Sister chromatid cohesion protein DCC1 n=1 Tax=Desmophyllum pertusum TaxID=174260 RepID=A0A9X0CRZ1_9CNID|nr:Sister chromatid cohesion protein DCC1 [Desmophyllum pertusum]
MAGERRTLEEVNKLADAAGLINRTGPVQVLHFSVSPNSDEYKLLELPPSILESLGVGNSVAIRGDHQDEAVLCTDKATFDLKMADTSNSLLLVPHCALPKDEEFKSEVSSLVHREVSSCHTMYFEVKPCRPRLEKLRFLLNDNLYQGPENELNPDDQSEEHQTNRQTLYTLLDLLSKVQASETELLEALKKIGALEIDGCWRLLDADYKERVVVGILTLLEEKDWSYEAVPMIECCDILEELEPRNILEHCLNCYGEVTDMDIDSGDNIIHYKLSEDKICRFYAEYLLRKAGRFNYHEFMDSWQQSVPEGMITKSEHLAGIALMDMKSLPPVIWHFPASALPGDLALRFMKLFKVQPKWTFDEIQPYISDLEAPGQSLNALLMKYARSSTDVTGVKVYNSKNPYNKLLLQRLCCAVYVLKQEACVVQTILYSKWEYSMK